MNLQIDIPAAFRWASSREDWWRPYLILGACTFIPLVGPFVHFGWQRRAFDAARAGDPVPDPEPLTDLGAGFKLLVGLAISQMILIVPFFLLLTLPVVALLIAAQQADPDVQPFYVLAAGLLNLMMFLPLIPVIVIQQELMRRELKGQFIAALRLGAVFSTIRRHAVEYVTIMLGAWLGQLVAGFGWFLCFVGMFFTLPFSFAVNCHLLAQFDKRVGEEA